MDFRVILRNRGRRDSLVFLGIAGFLGLFPVAVYAVDRSTAPASLIIGAVLALGFAGLALARLACVDALALSDDRQTLALFRSRWRQETRLDVPRKDVEEIRLRGRDLRIALKSGRPLNLRVESPEQASPLLRDLAGQLGVKFTSEPDEDF